ncbi:MAG: lytic transglycosylase domain-containing protein [Deltaproteobacteria bacterium]|nr:lytic transglycosylase domain-containing protein [Deltaproteobacteria bacterium]
MDKKINIQILFVEMIRFFFIFTMITGVSLVSIHNRPKDVQVINNTPDNLQDQNADFRSKFRHKKEHLFHPIILQEAIRNEIDPALVKAIIMAESGYNPNAVSKKGAKGLMQLMPLTARALGVEDAFNPEQNISGGVRYFKQLVNRFDGDVKLALAAYNAGSKKVRHYQGVPPFKSTHFYIEKVFKYYELYKDQMTEGMKEV